METYNADQHSVCTNNSCTSGTRPCNCVKCFPYLSDNDARQHATSFKSSKTASQEIQQSKQSDSNYDVPVAGPSGLQKHTSNSNGNSSRPNNYKYRRYSSDSSDSCYDSDSRERLFAKSRQNSVLCPIAENVIDSSSSSSSSSSTSSLSDSNKQTNLSTNQNPSLIIAPDLQLSDTDSNNSDVIFVGEKMNCYDLTGDSDEDVVVSTGSDAERNTITLDEIDPLPDVTNHISNSTNENSNDLNPTVIHSTNCSLNNPALYDFVQTELSQLNRVEDAVDS